MAGFGIMRCFILGDFQNPAADNADFRVGVQICGLLFKPFGERNVVMVHNRKIFPARHINQEVAAGRYAEIGRIAGISYPAVGIAFYDGFGGSVLGTVVQQQQFKIAKSLRQNTVDTSAQIFFPRTVNRHQNRNFRRRRFFVYSLAIHQVS